MRENILFIGRKRCLVTILCDPEHWEECHGQYLHCSALLLNYLLSLVLPCNSWTASTANIGLAFTRWNTDLRWEVNSVVKAGVTLHPGLPRTVPVCTCCPGLIINSTALTLKYALVWVISLWLSSWGCCRSEILPIRSDQSLSRVRLFATPWIAARQASLSITSSRSSLILTSIESVMPSSHLILCRPLLLLPPIPPSISLFQWVNSSHEVAKVLEFQL